MSSDGRTMKQIKVGGSSDSPLIGSHKLYRVKIEGKWYEGRFSKQWFGWQFDGYRSGIQLNLIDEVFELDIPRAPRGRTKAL
jgi:hypothetical protein